jgi:hypothetical protein
MKKLLEKLLGDKGWRVYDCGGNDFELSNWSNAGENVIISIRGENLSELVADARSAWENFNADEHAAEILIAKRSVDKRKRDYYAAAPDTLTELLRDANHIKSMHNYVYRRLFDYARKAGGCVK